MINLGHGSQIQIFYKLSGMRGQYKFSMASVNISQTQTIVPRLDYSKNLLAQIIDDLKNKKSQLEKTNGLFLIELEDKDQACPKTIDLERTVCFSLEILYWIQKRIGSVSKIHAIPKIFPSSIHMIRTISAQIVDILPKSSLQLSELSVHLSSIVLDSATITKAQFDFGKSNLDSSMLLDEVKLMVDSKIRKQYHHLNFFKVHNT
jgi:hypothetical protein